MEPTEYFIALANGQPVNRLAQVPERRGMPINAMVPITIPTSSSQNAPSPAPVNPPPPKVKG